MEPREPNQDAARRPEGPPLAAVEADPRPLAKQIEQYCYEYASRWVHALDQVASGTPVPPETVAFLLDAPRLADLVTAAAAARFPDTAETREALARVRPLLAFMDDYVAGTVTSGGEPIPPVRDADDPPPPPL